MPTSTAVTALIALSLAMMPKVGQAQAREVVFVDVAVIPLDRERIIAHQSVLVRDRRVVEVGPAAEMLVLVYIAR